MNKQPKTPYIANEKQFKIQAKDGYELSASLYEAKDPSAMLIIASATGVPQEFYRKFAQFTAQQGYTVITFDYRGIGRSKHHDLKGFNTTFTDWATLDLAAVVDEIATGDLPTFMVGHSFGGHAFGQLPNHQKIAGFYVFGTGAGWHGWMPKKEAWRVKVLWSAVLPVLSKWKGYLPSSMLGMGEDLPNGVYKQWKHWCQFPHYFFDDPELSGKMLAKFAEVKTPIFAANALDDSWATPKARNAFMKGYCNAKVSLIDIPLKHPISSIGHMGYFRSNAESLWKDVIHQFNQIKAEGCIENSENSRLYASGLNS